MAELEDRSFTELAEDLGLPVLGDDEVMALLKAGLEGGHTPAFDHRFEMEDDDGRRVAVTLDHRKVTVRFGQPDAAEVWRWRAAVYHVDGDVDSLLVDSYDTTPVRALMRLCAHLTADTTRPWRTQ